MTPLFAYNSNRGTAMQKPKIYLETSIFNFVFADDAPEKKADTLKLFEEIKAGRYEVYASEYVIAEIERDKTDKRGKMLREVVKCGAGIIPKSDEIDSLAEIYVKEGIIPLKHREDAEHIAATSVHGLDFIVSWNFQHIVKRKTLIMTEAINILRGYKKIGIFSPTEVIE